MLADRAWIQGSQVWAVKLMGPGFGVSGAAVTVTGPEFRVSGVGSDSDGT